MKDTSCTDVISKIVQILKDEQCTIYEAEVILSKCKDAVHNTIVNAPISIS